MKQKRLAARVQCISLQKVPTTMLALAACFLLGAVLGRLVSLHCAEELGAELRRYLDGYLSLRAEPQLSASVIGRTAVCFFRAPVAVFLLGFASIGVLLIPAVCAAQGFLLSFSLFCFSAGLGRDGFFLLLALFAVRLIAVLPCTLLLGSASWETARSLAAFSLGGGKRAKPVSYGGRCWSRFGVSCVCLALGAALELWIVPQVLSLLLR